MSRSNLFAHWRQDLPASLVVFLVALPLCLGVALASGAPPIAGLIAGVVGGILVGSLSGSPVGVSGPAAGLTAIVVVAIADLGSYELFLAAVVVAGLLQVVLGIVRAGVIAYYFPNSVVKGMLSGIGIIIILKQLPHAVGYDKDYEGDFTFLQADQQNTFSALGNVIGYITPGAVLISAVCLGILVLWEIQAIKRSAVLSKIPGPLLAVIAGILLGGLQSGFGQHGLDAEHYVDLPDLGNGPLALSTPDFSGMLHWKFWLTAVTLAFVASLETLLSVEAVDKLDPAKRITPTDRELRAQGIGNIVSGMIGGLPITQVIVRSSANVQSGGQSKLSTILHGALILLCVLLIPNVLEWIPLASLAAILIMIGYKLAAPAQIKGMWRKGWEQFVPFIVTILGVVFIDLLNGVMLGMAVGIFVVLRNNYLTPFHFDGNASIPGRPIQIALSEEVTFFNKASIQRTLASLPPGAHVVIDGTRTVNLDPDVREIIDEVKVRAGEQGIRIELTGFSEAPRKHTKVLSAGVLRAAMRSARYIGRRSTGTFAEYLRQPFQHPDMMDNKSDLHKILLARNKEWSERMHRENPELFTELAKHQNPFFLWIGCSDSRVPPNQITGTMPGDMFIHRNIANMVVHTDMNMLSVVDYGVNALGIDHIIVCGHYGCGGVKAAMGPEFGGPSGSWVRHIRDVARFHRDALAEITDEHKRFDRLVELNVAEQVYDLSRMAVLRDAWAKGRPIKVHGWVYGLKDGLIKDLGVTRSSFEHEESGVDVD
ncbi:MAG: SulP family inorganic anion transporter [Flavobacteriales bacterium]